MCVPLPSLGKCLLDGKVRNVQEIRKMLSTSVAQSVVCLLLDLSSGLDLKVMNSDHELEPTFKKKKKKRTRLECFSINLL